MDCVASQAKHWKRALFLIPVDMVMLINLVSSYQHIYIRKVDSNDTVNDTERGMTRTIVDA